MLTLAEATRRVQEREPFTQAEVDELAAFPVVREIEGFRLRDGSVVITAFYQAMAPNFSYPDAITNPLEPPSVVGTDVSKPL